MYTYLLINFFTILFPFIFSFDKKVNFVKNWRPLFYSIIITGFIMVVWDNYFTVRGFWGFSKEYLTGIYFFSLPIEEVLFFLTVPYACIFTYESVKVYIKKDILINYAKNITIFLIIFFSIMVLLNFRLAYTGVTSSLMIILLLFHLFTSKKNNYMGYFYLSYLFCLIPFLAVNGILTNGLRAISNNPIVWYNNLENLSIRFMNIPIEDTAYCMFMLLLNITIYEYFKKFLKPELKQMT